MGGSHFLPVFINAWAVLSLLPLWWDVMLCGGRGSLNVLIRIHGCPLASLTGYRSGPISSLFGRPELLRCTQRPDLCEKLRDTKRTTSRLRCTVLITTFCLVWLVSSQWAGIGSVLTARLLSILLLKSLAYFSANKPIPGPKIAESLCLWNEKRTCTLCTCVSVCFGCTVVGFFFNLFLFIIMS